MRQFNHEELEALKTWEKHFETAVKFDYHRNLEPRYLMQIKTIYDLATGGDYKFTSTCGHCVLKFLKTVGKKYFEDLEAYKAKAEKMVEVLDEVFGDVPDDEVQQEPEPKPAKKAPAKKSTKKATSK